VAILSAARDQLKPRRFGETNRSFPSDNDKIWHAGYDYHKASIFHNLEGTGIGIDVMTFHDTDSTHQEEVVLTIFPSQCVGKLSAELNFQLC